MRLSPNYGNILQQKFYSDSPENVAKKLLGKLLIRILDDMVIGGMITEVEAYFGREDPASRASKKGKIGDAMWRDPGYTLIYMVHGNWLLNIVTTEGRAGAVLIRSLEPLIGIEHMRRFRGVTQKKLLTTGPGRLTKALKITNEEDGIPVFEEDSVIKVVDYLVLEDSDIERSYRIGVTKDLPEPYRFYVKYSDYVSKKVGKG